MRLVPFYVLAASVLLLAAGAHAAEGDVVLTGLVAQPQTFSLADLKAMVQAPVDVTQQAEHGPVRQNCRGPLLSLVLEKAGLSLGDAKYAPLRHTLLVTAADKYAAALSLAEMDPGYGGAVPVLAVECDGKPLAMPKLVVPSDKKNGRAVHSVTGIEVR